MVINVLFDAFGRHTEAAGSYSNLVIQILKYAVLQIQLQFFNPYLTCQFPLNLQFNLTISVYCLNIHKHLLENYFNLYLETTIQSTISTSIN
jgi:hypothetical protein